MAGVSARVLRDVASAEGGNSKQPLNNEGQMDLYDDLINDIIGVPSKKAAQPKLDNYNRLLTRSNNIVVPIKVERGVADKPAVTLPEEKTLLIGNLTWWTTGDDLVIAIRSAGIFNVGEIKFYEVAKGGQSKGFVRVNLSSDWDLKRLLEKLPKNKVHGRTLDVRQFTTINRQYFETQFITAMAKPKRYSENPEERRRRAAVLLARPKAANPVLISVSVPPPNIPGPVLGECGQSQTLQAACVAPATFMIPTNISLSAYETPPMYNPYYNDYNMPGRETEFFATQQSEKELIKELDREDDSSEDYGNLIKLVSFVKKTKAITQDSPVDSSTCPPNQLHGEEAKPYSSGLWEHEYPRWSETRRSSERSGPPQDRSRSPSSCDSHYQEKKRDYDQTRQWSPQSSHFEDSPRRDHLRDRNFERRERSLERRERSLERRDRSQERRGRSKERRDSMRGKREDYSREKYCEMKHKDREYRF